MEEVFSQVKWSLQNDAAVFQAYDNPGLIIYSPFMEVTAADFMVYIDHAIKLLLMYPVAGATLKVLNSIAGI